MVMGSKVERSPEVIRERREDRSGWLFALATTAGSCVVILAGIARAHS